MGERILTVQQSFPPPQPTTNPYIVMLRDHLAATPGVTVREFRWRDAIFGSFDVFHAHWPENLVSGHGPVKTAVRQLLTAVLLAKFRLLRIPVVRTVHNLELPSGLSRRQRLLLTWFEQATTLRIALNGATTFPSGQAHSTILHGHYREWFAAYPKPATVAGRFGYFGLIRRYKNVETLLRAFTGVPGQRSLRVAGNPSGRELSDEITTLAKADGRISLSLGYVSDEELADLVGESQLVVLPYRHMHNSGGVLTSLSLDRPVLVPANEANSLLAAEVGEGWIYSYEGELTAAILEDAIARVQTDARAEHPDLSARNWDVAGPRYVAAYRDALRLRRGAPRS